MDDQQPASGQLMYRCPGQSYTIDRAVHLARLATFFPGCRGCEHRHDAAGRLPLQARQWEQFERRAPVGPRLAAESIEGTAHGDVDVPLARRVAGVLASWLWHRRPPSAGPPTVLVGTDGTWSTADLVPATCGVLALSGCRAWEVGAVTSPCLAAAAWHTGAEAALWLGNSSGRPRAMSIKLWQQRAVPASSPGVLDEPLASLQPLASLDAAGARPARGGGQLARYDAEAVYLPTFEGMFHALRPLVVVLATTCEPLVRYWERLAVESACRIIRAQCGGDLLARRIVDERADCAASIDGDGESLHLVDERGRGVDPESVLLLLARYIASQRGRTTVVVEPDASDRLRAAIERLVGRVETGGATRQAMCERMETTGAVVGGGGASGRQWFGGPPPASDALLSLVLLVAILSQSDRTLSEALDAAWSGG